MNILAIIPARGGSKGIPHKNIKQFDGRPLIYYAVKLAEQAKGKGIITDHLVSTDDETIALMAGEHGGNVPFLRPRQLAADDSPVIDALIHAVNWWEEHHKHELHSILILQATNPLTVLEDISGSIKHYLDNQSKARCLISVCDAQHVRLPTLYRRNGIYMEQVLKGIDPVVSRQALTNLYWRNGAIYLSRRDLLLGEKKIIDESPLFYEMPRVRSVAIDDMCDWIIAESLMTHNKKTQT